MFLQSDIDLLFGLYSYLCMFDLDINVKYSDWFNINISLLMVVNADVWFCRDYCCWRCPETKALAKRVVHQLVCHYLLYMYKT